MKNKFDLRALFFADRHSARKSHEMLESPNASTRIDYSQQEESTKQEEPILPAYNRVCVPKLKQQAEWTHPQDDLDAEIYSLSHWPAEQEVSRHVDLNELIGYNECVSCDDRYMFKQVEAGCRGAKRRDRPSKLVGNSRRHQIGSSFGPEGGE